MEECVTPPDGNSAHAGGKSRDRAFLLWENTVYHTSCDLNAQDATNCATLQFMAASPHILKFSWHCHLIWPGVNLTWTSVHYAKGAGEVRRKQVASFSHSYSEHWNIDFKEKLEFFEFYPRLLLLLLAYMPVNLVMYSWYRNTDMFMYMCVHDYKMLHSQSEYF